MGNPKLLVFISFDGRINTQQSKWTALVADEEKVELE